MCNIFITIIVISVVIALIQIRLQYKRDIFMQPATYQKCTGSYSNLHYPTEVEWQIKNTLQILFQWPFFDRDGVNYFGK